MTRVILAGLPKNETERLQKIYETVNTPCEVTPSVDAAIERIPANPPALVVMPFDGRIEPVFGMSEVIRTSAPVTALIAILPEPKMELALKVFRAGAYDCVSRPFKPLDILAASKRAAHHKGRALFVAKVEPPKHRWIQVLATACVILLFSGWLGQQMYGPPMDQISLASAHISGLQWENRQLWVGDWYDSNILCYRVKPGLTKKYRELETVALYKMADGQPMLLCNTPQAIMTIGTDLKMRSHQRLVGLPTVQTITLPGNRPTGLVWDGKNVWVADSDDSALYRFGNDFKVLDSVKSIIPNPLGLAYDDGALWVLGGDPLKAARLKKESYGYVWHGPYNVQNLLMEGVTPSGMAIHFGRLWVVSGGYPMMVSKSINEIIGDVMGWPDKVKRTGAG